MVTIQSFRRAIARSMDARDRADRAELERLREQMRIAAEQERARRDREARQEEQRLAEQSAALVRVQAKLSRRFWTK